MPIFSLKKLVHNDFFIYLCSTKIKKGGVYEMSYKNGLIFRIFRLLALIETAKNQSIIRQIEGLLNELLENEEN